MSIHIIFSGRTHKESETITDCQDFFHRNSEQNCCAIADGASQSFYPSLWAELLVNHFCQNPDITPENWQLWLKPIQEEWLHKVTEKVETAKRDFNPVWVTNINRFNRRDSATSTFIGLEFLEDCIQVSLVGDSCLFIVKNHQSINTLIASYPIDNSQDFGNRPEYFASYEKNNDFQPIFLDIPFEKSSNLEEKYYFILATDALSEFIFQWLENNKDIWDFLITISSKNEFESFVKEARHSNDVKMKNDDVTLMILEVNNLKIPQPLPSTNLPTETQINNLLPTVVIASEEEVNQEENEDKVISTPLKPNNNPHDHHNLPLEENKNLVELAKNYGIKFIERLEVIPTQIKFLLNNNRETITPNEQNQVRDLKKSNRNLKWQRNTLFILLLFAYFIGNFIGKNSVNQTMVNFDEQNVSSENVPDNSDSSSDSNQKSADNQNNINSSTPDKPKINEPKSIDIDVSTTIYKDEQLSEILIESTQTKINTPVIQTGEDWVKIIRNVHSHKSYTKEKNCESQEITPIENIRIEPDKNAQLFGTLKQPSQFKNVEIDSELTWCKFQFEGYIKR